MTKFRCCACLLPILASCLAFGQENPGAYTTFHANEEVRVPQLPALMARSHDPSDALLTSLAIVFHDPGICCDKESALEDRAQAADPASLKEIASRIEGKWTLGDGRRILITPSFLAPEPSIDISLRIISPLKDKHAMLMVWNSHLYVLYGAVFDELGNEDGSSSFMIHKLFLLDPRYSGPRREITFNRDTDDWGKVEGVLLLTVRPQ
jgi:hypothetical protein